MTQTYFKLKPNVTQDELAGKLNHFTQIYFADFIKGSNYQNKPEIFFEPLKEIAFNWYIWDTFTAKSDSFLLFSVFYLSGYSVWHGLIISTSRWRAIRSG